MLPYNKNLKYTARTLRKNMTEQEKNLWYKFLRNYPVKFNRQKVIGNYIVDFYCNSAKIAVELDASQHYREDNEAYDKLRIEYLKSLCIKVIRFTNSDCENNFEGVCLHIDTQINKSMNT